MRRHFRTCMPPNSRPCRHAEHLRWTQAHAPSHTQTYSMLELSSPVIWHSARWHLPMAVQCYRTISEMVKNCQSCHYGDVAIMLGFAFGFRLGLRLCLVFFYVLFVADFLFMFSFTISKPWAQFYTEMNVYNPICGSHSLDEWFFKLSGANSNINTRLIQGLVFIGVK